MKRAQKPEAKCRRMEFKCELYSIIKELDRSLRSDCGQSKLPPSQSGGPSQLNGYPGNERKRKGSECCCPPGCCKESMEFRLPKLLPKEDPSGYQEADEGYQDPQGTGTGYLGWHDEDHSRGCRPDNGGGSNTGYGGGSGGSPNFGGASPKCGGGSPNFGGGCCVYKPLVDQCQPVSGPTGPQEAFQFPKTPEEAILRGCFVARSA